VRLGIIGPQRDRAVVGRDRVGVPPKPGENVTARRQRHHVGWIERERLLDARQCVRGPAEVAQGVAAVHQRIHVLAVDRQRLVGAGERILRPVERPQDARVVGVAVGGRGIDRKRPADQAVRLGELAALGGDQAEEMQRLELVGIAAEHLPVERLCLRQLPRPVRGNALLHEVGERRHLRSCGSRPARRQPRSSRGAESIGAG